MSFSSSPVGLPQVSPSSRIRPQGRSRSSTGDSQGSQAQGEKSYSVYKATSPSGKVYVGITCTGLATRMRNHYAAARRGSPQLFAKALRKYGPAMCWEPLEDGIPSAELAAAREKHYIALFDSRSPSRGYNLTDGGYPTTEEIRARKSHAALANMTQARRSNLDKGREAWIGRKHSAKSIEKMKAAHLGKTASDETRQKMSEAHQGRKKTEEHKRKIKLGNAHPLLRSDGVAFLSGQDADAALGLIGKGDCAAKSMRRGGICCGFTFTRISLDEYLSFESAGQAWDGTIPSEPHHMAHKGWSWSKDQRAKLMGSRQRLHSEQHKRNRIAAISKPVHCSDGRLFHSIGEAATVFGINTDQVSYACRKGRLLNGQILSYEPVIEGAVVASMTRMANSPTLPKSLCRSDGKVYQTMGGAARELDVSASTMTYALKHGTRVKGFMFTRTESPIRKEL